MIKKVIRILTLVFFTLNLNCFVLANVDTKILYKINNQIITNIDLENEKKFLLFLNPNLNNLSDQQIKSISQNSLTNRKIKEIELDKFFDLNDENLGKDYINNFIYNSNFQNIENFRNELDKVKLQFEYFEKNFLIDNVWREYIFNRFKSQVKINVSELREQIISQENKIEELNLSEILFSLESNLSLEKLVEKIFYEIENYGFEAAASIYSISDTKNVGGNLGWIKSNQISKNIYDEIKAVKNITKPIKTNNGYLIIKINDKREINEKIDVEEELSKLINIETEKEINKLGYIYFNKIKKRTFISEN